MLLGTTCFLADNQGIDALVRHLQICYAANLGGGGVRVQATPDASSSLHTVLYTQHRDCRRHEQSKNEEEREAEDRSL